MKMSDLIIEAGNAPPSLTRRAIDAVGDVFRGKKKGNAEADAPSVGSASDAALGDLERNTAERARQADNAGNAPEGKPTSDAATTTGTDAAAPKAKPKARSRANTSSGNRSKSNSNKGKAADGEKPTDNAGPEPTDNAGPGANDNATPKDATTPDNATPPDDLTFPDWDAWRQPESDLLREPTMFPRELEIPRAETPAIDTTPSVAVDDPAEIARLTREIQARLDAANPTPPVLTQQQRLEKVLKDLDNATTEKQIRDAEARLKAMQAEPAPGTNAVLEPGTNTGPASTISVDNGAAATAKEKPSFTDRLTQANKVRQELSDLAGAVPGLKTATTVGLGLPIINTGVKAGTGIDVIGGLNKLGGTIGDTISQNLGGGKTQPAGEKDMSDDELSKRINDHEAALTPKTQQESISTILKLSGQRPITERDNTVGITKPRAIRTLTESTNLAECGMGSPSYSQPASFSINASAGSGDEVANMLKSIMHLAGVKPVTGDMLGAEILPQVHDMEIISASPEMMGMPEMDHDDMGHADVIEIDGVMGDHDEEEKVGEEYDNTPHPQVDTEDPLRKWANVVNKNDMSTIPPGAPGDNKLQNTLGNSPVKEATDVHNSLLKAYEAFKNS
jgi:hypothetical protein